jgi:hypothetical protein
VTPATVAMDAANPRPRFPRLREFALGRPAWLVLFVGAVILVFRRPDQIRNPQLWAEDGIFFVQTYHLGWSAFLTEVAGYSQLAPRLIAGLARLFDPRWVPHVFVGSALALTLYTLSRALSSRCPLPRRGLSALAIVLVPDAAEVLLNAGNIQWVLAGAFILLLISADPQRNTPFLHDLIAAIGFGLSGPFSILLAPFFVWRAATRRTRASTVLAVVVGTCAVIQIVSILRHPQLPPAGATLDGHALLAVAGLRVAGGLLLGPFLPSQLPWLVGVALTVVTLVAVGARCRGSRGVDNWRLFLGLAFGALLTSTLYRCWHSLPAISALGAAARYFYPVQLLVLWLLLACGHSGTRVPRLVTAAIAAWMVAINVPRMREPPVPDMRWGDYVPKLRAGEEVTISINPGG